jgi:hypothetical protein
VPVQYVSISLLLVRDFGVDSILISRGGYAVVSPNTAGELPQRLHKRRLAGPLWPSDDDEVFR